MKVSECFNFYSLLCCVYVIIGMLGWLIILTDMVAKFHVKVQILWEGNRFFKNFPTHFHITYYRLNQCGRFFQLFVAFSHNIWTLTSEPKFRHMVYFYSSFRCFKSPNTVLLFSRWLFKKFLRTHCLIVITLFIT